MHGRSDEVLQRKSKEGREVGSVEKFTLSDRWWGKASMRRGHFSKDLMEGRVGAQWYLGGGEVYQPREQKVQRP